VLLANGFIERNSWLPGVAAAVVLFIVGTGITLYLRQRDKDSKHLDYQILSDTPIVISRRKRPEILKVVFGNTEVSNPYITEVRFKNTGKQVIQADDFLAQIAIQRRNAKVLDVNVVEESAKNLVEYAELTIDPADDEIPVHVKPLTLNRGDWFTIQVIYDSSVTADERVSVTCRINGEDRRPQVYQDREPIPTIVKTLLSVTAIFALILIAAGAYLAHIGNPSHPPSPGNSIYAGGLAAVGSTLFGGVLGAVFASFRKPPKFLAKSLKFSA
jgi:hypothetical protein